MKLQGRAARDWLRDPKGAVPLVLISGADPVRVDQARARVLDAWVGHAAAAEMRLDRLSAADLRADAARLLDAMKAIGFFGGPRAVWVEDATDGLAPGLSIALDAWAEGDARLVVTAGTLTAKSALRSLAERRKDALALILGDESPTPAEVAADLTETGLRPDPEAQAALEGWAGSLPAGEWAGLVERLALHELGSLDALDAATVTALAPQALDGDLDGIALALARRDATALVVGLRRAFGQRTSAVSVAISVARHIRGAIAVQTGGYPPGGTLRTTVAAFGDGWTGVALESALQRVAALDLTLRQGSGEPAEALVERELLGLARR